MEEGARNQGLERTKKQTLLETLLRHTAPPTLMVAHRDPCQIRRLENYTVIALCCFKPLTLWLFVTAVIGNENTHQD